MCVCVCVLGLYGRSNRTEAWRVSLGAVLWVWRINHLSSCGVISNTKIFSFFRFCFSIDCLQSVIPISRSSQIVSYKVRILFSALGPWPDQSWRQPCTAASKASVFFHCFLSWLLLSFSFLKKYFLSCELLICNKQPSLCARVLACELFAGCSSVCGCRVVACKWLQDGPYWWCSIGSHPTATNSPDRHFLISPRPPCVCVCVEEKPESFEVGLW